MLDRAGIRNGEVFVRLLTNRAACHLSLARPLLALKDCEMAVQVQSVCFVTPQERPFHVAVHLMVSQATDMLQTDQACTNC